MGLKNSNTRIQVTLVKGVGFYEKYSHFPNFFLIRIPVHNNGVQVYFIGVDKLNFNFRKVPGPQLTDS